MMRIYFLLLVFLLCLNGNAQVINFPDANFKQILLYSNENFPVAQDINGNGISIDINQDGEIEVSEVSQVYGLFLDYSDIQDVTGISFFTNLTSLSCAGNPINTIDFSGLSQLSRLYSDNTNFLTLDLSGVSTLTYLSCSNSNLTSLNLSGLTNLTYLNCNSNQLTELNLNGLTALIDVDCSNNQLTLLNLDGLNGLLSISCKSNNLSNLLFNSCESIVSIDCSENFLTNLSLVDLYNLQDLNCKNNELNSINLFGLINLYSLDCSQNQLTNLILSGLGKLSSLDCSNNLLSSIDIRELAFLSVIKSDNNQLETIFINNGLQQDFSQSNIGNTLTIQSICADASEVSFLQGFNCPIETNCSLLNSNFYLSNSFKMKLLEADVSNSIAKDSSGNSIKVDTNNDGVIQEIEVLPIYKLDVNGALINDLTGINRFVNLTELNCSNNNLQYLNIEGLGNLTVLDCSFNLLNNINLSSLINLTDLSINNNLLGSLQLNTLINLQTLNCSNNSLSSINVSNLTNLETFLCSNNQIELLNLNNLAALTILDCSSNLLTLLNLVNSVLLDQINCSNNVLNSLYIKNGSNESVLDFSNNSSLTTICSDDSQAAQVQSLITLYGYANCTNSSNCDSYILFSDSKFKNILLQASASNTIAKNATGNYVKIDLNNDNEIQFSEAQQIVYLNINNQSSPNSRFTNVDGLSSFVNLINLNCSYNNLINIDVNNLTSLFQFNCSNNQLNELNISSLTELYTLQVDNNSITSLNFENSPSLEQIICGNNQISSLDLSNLLDLQLLDCSFNQISSLDLTGLVHLNLVHCQNNLLTTLDITDNPVVASLACYNNLLTSLNVNGVYNLNSLTCHENQLETLDISGLNNLQQLYCYDNNLSTINLSNSTNIEIISARNNQLQSIDLSGLVDVHYLELDNNQISFLNASDLTSLTTLSCNNNNLTSLIIKNGRNESILTFLDNPNLLYICADDAQIEAVKSKANLYGYTNCEVNSYCSFTPGGIYYSIQGNSLFDLNNDGCNVGDSVCQNLKFLITNGSASGNVIANESGNYFIPVQAAAHTLTPIFETPSYFTASPQSVTVTFPTQLSPYTQDFCITPNGIHNDLEVAIVPLAPARPGFDVTYKVVYKNKGATTLSGSVTFQFEDNKMDFISSTPLFSSQVTGLLTYDYLNLQPFETREVLLTMNINSPQETPAVNSGDQLNFTVVINLFADDETVEDNTSILKQTVVASFDPNDKTCVEGNVVGPEMIGQYVHYMIRFENTGTFPAQNIVVKDLIDLTKFDLSTLIPTSSSHSFVTRIAADGKVEFIFESIQLPFDDANNDGYIAFKIKTLPSLAIGDSFSNNANIYFDYNFPIETNTASTTIQALENVDFDFAEYITLYPNPAQNELNIRVKNDISISSMSIYNALGQLVLTSTNPTESIDVSSLKTGNYFVKVISDKGTSSSRFLKE